MNFSRKENSRIPSERDLELGFNLDVICAYDRMHRLSTMIFAQIFVSHKRLLFKPEQFNLERSTLSPYQHSYLCFFTCD